MFQITQNGSYTFLNILIRADKLIIKVLTRSFIMVNTMMEIESTNFTDISIFALRSWSQVMVFIFVFRHMKFLAILLQVKASQNFD